MRVRVSQVRERVSYVHERVSYVRERVSHVRERVSHVRERVRTSVNAHLRKRQRGCRGRFGHDARGATKFAMRIKSASRLAERVRPAAWGLRVAAEVSGGGAGCISLAALTGPGRETVLPRE
jgi:hypothetical protein